MVEQDKVGGTCLHRGCVPAKEFLETAAVYRTVGSAGEFGISSGQARGRLLREPGSQERGRRPAVPGSGRAAEGPQGRAVRRNRHAPPRPSGSGRRRPRCRRRGGRPQRDSGGRFGAAQPSGARDRREAGPHLRRVLGPRSRAGGRGDRRRRGDRLRVRLAALRPRCPGDPDRGARFDPGLAAIAMSPPSSTARSASAGSRSSPEPRSKGTPRKPDGSGTVVALARRPQRRGVDDRRVGRPPPPHRGPARRGHRRGAQRRWLRRGRPLPCERTLTASGRSATWSPGHPSWPTSASPRRSSPSRASSASRSCRWTTSGCPGPSTATRRWRSPA